MTDLTTTAIATVEWALVMSEYGSLDCRICDTATCEYGGQHPPTDAQHWGDCPIPALGAAILREVHWYTREWARAGRQLEGDPCWIILSWGWTAHPSENPRLCQRPRGHDSGIHEPTPEELT